MWGQAANAALGQAQRLLTRAGVRADVTVPPAMHEYYEKGKVALEQLSAVPGVKMASSLLATAAANAPSPRIIPRSKRRILALLLPLLLLWMILPYDNIFVLVLRWHGGRMWRGLVETMEGAQAVATDSWLYHDSGSSGGSGISRDGRAAPYPVDMRTDVGVILKTGFGTRKRLDAWFEAFVESGGDSGRFLPEDVMVIADFAVDESNSTVEYKGRKLQIRDAVEIMDASGALPAFQTNDRLWKHKNMTTAIAHGKEGAATMISKEAGWSMDAMKVKSWITCQSKETRF